MSETTHEYMRFSPKVLFQNLCFYLSSPPPHFQEKIQPKGKQSIPNSPFPLCPSSTDLLFMSNTVLSSACQSWSDWVPELLYYLLTTVADFNLIFIYILQINVFNTSHKLHLVLLFLAVYHYGC